MDTSCSSLGGGPAALRSEHADFLRRGVASGRTEVTTAKNMDGFKEGIGNLQGQRRRDSSIGVYGRRMEWMEPGHCPNVTGLTPENPGLQTCPGVSSLHCDLKVLLRSTRTQLPGTSSSIRSSVLYSKHLLLSS